MSLSKMLLERRKELGISLRDLSEKTKLSHTFIRDVEKEKYAPSLENAIKLANALELNLEEVIIKAFQFHQRESLLQLINVCHDHNLEIPYNQWVKSSLPIQPLSNSKDFIHETAFKIAKALYHEASNDILNKKLALINKITIASYTETVYDTVPAIVESINISSRLHGLEHVKAKVKQFINEINDDIKATLIKKEED